MQHIPVVSHAFWKEDFSFVNGGVVHTIQTTGSYCTIDRTFTLCLFTVGKSLHRTRGAEWWSEGYSLRLAFRDWISTEG